MHFGIHTTLEAKEKEIKDADGFFVIKIFVLDQRFHIRGDEDRIMKDTGMKKKIEKSVVEGLISFFDLSFASLSNILIKRQPFAFITRCPFSFSLTFRNLFIIEEVEKQGG